MNDFREVIAVGIYAKDDTMSVSAFSEQDIYIHCSRGCLTFNQCMTPEQARTLAAALNQAAMVAERKAA